MSLRKKLFIGYLIAFFIFAVALFPFSSWTVKTVAKKILTARASELISQIEKKTNEGNMVSALKDRERYRFFRITLLDKEGRVVYDSNSEQILGERFQKGFFARHEEVEEAMASGRGYSESFSKLLDQKFIYVATAFHSSGGAFYILRTAFPYNQLGAFIDHFDIIFFVLGSVVLCLFFAVTLLVTYYFSKPIHQIAKVLKEYKEGAHEAISNLNLKEEYTKEDVGELVRAIEGASEKMQNRINKLERERFKRETILETLVDGIIAVDNKMVVSYINGAAVEMLGADIEEFVGKRFSAFKYDNFFDLLEMSIEQKRMIIRPSQEIEGTEGLFDVIATPNDVGKGAILILQDKTSHYNFIGKQKKFLANASSELKMPIAVISNFAEQLEGRRSLSSEERSKLAEKIKDNCDRMSLVVKNLFALASSEKLSISSFEDVDVLNQIEQCKNLLLERYPEAKVDIKCDKEVIVRGASSLLEIVFINMFENAVKFSLKNVEISVRVKKEGNNAKIEIKDKGIGIKEEDLPHIFEGFYRVHYPRVKELKGAGLGLSIAKNIVKKHFGKINVKSKFGKGSSFEITLPLSNAQ